MVAFTPLGDVFPASNDTLGTFNAGQEAFFQKDYARALEKWSPLAKQGHTEAQINLGYMYLQGLGVKTNYIEALKWYRRAADQGSADAQTQVGTIYFHGYGVKQDYAEAAKWYKRSAAQNDAGGLSFLASLYAHGLGVKRDFEMAYSLAKKAANLDDPAGQMLLAQFLANGYGVMRDKVQALMWYGLVISHKDTPARPELGPLAAQALEESKVLMASMSEEDISKASGLLRSWKPQESLVP